MCHSQQTEGGDPYKNDLEEHFLVNLHELLIPFIDICRFLAAVRIIIGCCRGIALVVFTPLDNLFQNRLIHLSQSQQAQRATVRSP